MCESYRYAIIFCSGYTSYIMCYICSIIQHVLWASNFSTAVYLYYFRCHTAPLPSALSALSRESTSLSSSTTSSASPLFPFSDPLAKNYRSSQSIVKPSTVRPYPEVNPERISTRTKWTPDSTRILTSTSEKNAIERIFLAKETRRQSLQSAEKEFTKQRKHKRICKF